MKIKTQNVTETTKDYVITCEKCKHEDHVTVPIETNIRQESLSTEFTHECSVCKHVNS